MWIERLKLVVSSCISNDPFGTSGCEDLGEIEECILEVKIRNGSTVGLSSDWLKASRFSSLGFSPMTSAKLNTLVTAVLSCRFSLRRSSTYMVTRIP